MIEETEREFGIRVRQRDGEDAVAFLERLKWEQLRRDRRIFERRMLSGIAYGLATIIYIGMLKASEVNIGQELFLDAMLLMCYVPAWCMVKSGG